MKKCLKKNESHAALSAPSFDNTYSMLTLKRTNSSGLNRRAFGRGFTHFDAACLPNDAAICCAWANRPDRVTSTVLYRASNASVTSGHSPFSERISMGVRSLSSDTHKNTSEIGQSEMAAASNKWAKISRD